MSQCRWLLNPTAVPLRIVTLHQTSCPLQQLKPVNSVNNDESESGGNILCSNIRLRDGWWWWSQWLNVASPQPVAAFYGAELQWINIWQPCQTVNPVRLKPEKCPDPPLKRDVSPRQRFLVSTRAFMERFWWRGDDERLRNRPKQASSLVHTPTAGDANGEIPFFGHS